MAIKGAIFDMDGTLLDSMHVWVNIAGDYLSTKNIQMTPKIEKELGGLMLKDIAEYFIKNFGFELQADEIIVEINHLVENEYFHKVTVKPGVLEFLETLKCAGVRMCVATASDRYLVEAALKRVGIDGYFDAIFTCSEVAANKTSPDIYFKSLEFLGTDIGETYVFEDTYTPVRTAKLAGFHVVGVADKWSAHKRASISSTADIFVDNMTEIDISKL